MPSISASRVAARQLEAEDPGAAGDVHHAGRRLGAQARVDLRQARQDAVEAVDVLRAREVLLALAELGAVDLVRDAAAGAEALDQGPQRAHERGRSRAIGAT